MRDYVIAWRRERNARMIENGADLAERTVNCLRCMELGEEPIRAATVAALGRERVSKFPHVGKKTMADLDKWLAAQGYELN